MVRHRAESGASSVEIQDSPEALKAIIAELEAKNAILTSALDKANRTIVKQNEQIEELTGEVASLKHDQAKNDILTEQILQMNERDRRLEVLSYPSFLETVAKLRSNMNRAKDMENRNGALMMIDIDHFKQINDTYGHPVGDQALTALVTELKRRTRNSDLICRYGGEEFCIYFPGSTAADIAEKFTAEGENLASFRVSFVPTDENGAPREKINFTVSGGLCNVQEKEDLEKVIAAADSLLYEAKEGGRDKILTPESAIA